MSENSKSFEKLRLESNDSASYVEEIMSNCSEAKTIEIDPSNPISIRFLNQVRILICLQTTAFVHFPV